MKRAIRIFVTMAFGITTPSATTFELFHFGGDNNDDNSDTFQQSI